MLNTHTMIDGKIAISTLRCLRMPAAHAPNTTPHNTLGRVSQKARLTQMDLGANAANRRYIAPNHAANSGNTRTPTLAMITIITQSSALVRAPLEQVILTNRCRTGLRNFSDPTGVNEMHPCFYASV